MQNEKGFINIKRWYKFILSQDEVQAVVRALPKDIDIKPIKYEEKVEKVEKSSTPRDPPKKTKGEHQVKQTKDEGKFVDLPGEFYKKTLSRHKLWDFSNLGDNIKIIILGLQGL